MLETKGEREAHHGDNHEKRDDGKDNTLGFLFHMICIVYACISRALKGERNT